MAELGGIGNPEVRDPELQKRPAGVANPVNRAPGEIGILPGEGVPPTTPGGPGDVTGQPVAVDPNTIPAGPAAPPAPEGLSDIAQRMLNVSSSDVDYLRGEPYKTTEEQAMRAREQDRVRTEYGTARQRLIDTLGPEQGMSGVMAGALGKLGEAEASEMSKVDRDIMIKAADEMRSRRGESRGIMTGLEGLERQRMMESLGLGQTMDESERSRLNDLMAAMGMAPNPAQATGAAGNLLQYASSLGDQARTSSASNIQGISTLADLFSKLGWMK